MKLFRHISTIVWGLASFVAKADEPRPANVKCAANQPADAELLLLQGTWEGVDVGAEKASKNPDSQETGKRKPGEIDLDFLKTGVSETPPQPHGKITITITGNSFHFHRDKNFWFDTTITLPAGTNPKQLKATIKDCPTASSIGEVVVAIFKIEDGILTLATGNGDGEAPKSFEAPGLNRYELRKIQPQKNPEPGASQPAVPAPESKGPPAAAKEPVPKESGFIGSGLDSLVLEGPELHASLRTRHLDAVRHVPRAAVPANPHHSTNADFVEAVARSGSQGSLGREGIRSALFALYLGETEIGFYGLEAASEEGATRREEALRRIWSHMMGIGRAQIHREGLVIVVVWHDGVSPECWKAVNAKVAERLARDRKASKTDQISGKAAEPIQLERQAFARAPYERTIDNLLTNF